MAAINTSQSLTVQRPSFSPPAQAPAKPKVARSVEGRAVDVTQQSSQSPEIQESGIKIDPAQQEQSKESKAEDLKGSLESLMDEFNNRVFRQRDTRLQFKIDSDTGSVIVQVVDKDNEQVLRSIPPEEVIALRKRLMEMVDLKGALLDKKG